MKKIDCFGDICPIPLLKMNREIEELASGESFQIVVDHSCVIENIRDTLGKSKLIFVIDEVLNGVWEVTITMP